MKINKSSAPIFTGFLLWLLLIGITFPVSIFSLDYVVVLILAAPLFLVPLTWKINGEPVSVIWLALAAAVFFSGSFLLEEGYVAGILTLPWLILTIQMGLQVLRKWWDKKEKTIFVLSRLAAGIYLPVGALWALADRVDVQPLGFLPAIVLLTAAHFHFAGFILPLATGWVLESFQNRNFNWMGWAVILGVPLVALGITSTQLGGPVWIEMLSVIVMALSAASVGILHVAFALKNRENRYAWLFAFGGLALLIGMGLAFLYGIRFIFPIPFLTIPWMYAVHGTLNAVGFALPVLLGWYFYKKENE